ncbi:MAG: PEGA domain-containing protein [Labilithrix sp.]
MSLKNVFAIVLALSTLLLVARSARAADPTKEQCVSANEDADALRKRGALRAARTSLLTCVSPSCPRLVRDDCNLRINELDVAIPTIAFTARENTTDTTAVSISMDGQPLVNTIDGKPVAVDPGEHTFTFFLEGYPPQTQKLVIREGEKARGVQIQFGEAPKLVEARPDGRLVVVAAPEAAIAIDGKATVMGRYDSALSAGGHEVKVTQPGKVTFTRFVEVKSNETETLNVTLETEKKRSSLLPWIIGGAAVVAAAIVVGGVIAFSSGTESKTVPPPPGTLGGVSFASFR